jgi:hypothetical protein
MHFPNMVNINSRHARRTALDTGESYLPHCSMEAASFNRLNRKAGLCGLRVATKYVL